MANDQTACCIVGGGPAGAMLGLLLARAGVSVTVLEKHADFLRDFRGDTIHPSTLEILDELGLADRFLSLPHTQSQSLRLRTELGETISIDFSRLPTRFPYIAFVPQWDFLNFLTDEARQYATFDLRMQADAQDLVIDGGVVRGVRYRDADNNRHEIRAALTIGADGRASVTRESARLPLATSDPPMDVLWFRLPRRADEREDADAHIGAGHFLVQLNRGAYWQIAFTIPKGTLAQLETRDISALRSTITQLAPELADRVDELRSWHDVKLLTVQANRLRRWYRPGYLAIGDAAHAMSPVGGVGINVAIQDAVVAANTLWLPLWQHHLSISDLARVQRRREIAVRLIQAIQSVLQTRILKPVMHAARPVHLSPALRVALATPGVRDIPAHLLGFGVARPHVRTPRGDLLGSAGRVSRVKR